MNRFSLQGVVYQLDAALEDPQTQRCGLIFIYDMSDSKYSNFDYDLSIKILSLLKVLILIFLNTVFNIMHSLQQLSNSFFFRGAIRLD